MGLNSVFEIGRSGLGIYQTAIEVTGQNIANVNTQGYSRQQVLLETAPPSSSNGFPMGSGARIAAIQRTYDGLLQQQMVTAQSTEGNDTTKSNVLQQIEPTFNEVANDGLGAAISNFFGAWQDLTLNPAGSTERQTVLSRAKSMIDNFNSISTTLNNTITAQDNALVPLTGDISANLKNIAQLNDQIKIYQVVSGSANELKDRRDQFIRDLSTKVGVSYTENSDGTVDVTLTGGGQALVTGNKYAAMFTDNAGGTTTNDIYITAVGNPPLAAILANGTIITATVGGTNNSLGELGATLAIRDTKIPGYLAKVDELAFQIASNVNTKHSAGYALDGATTGVIFFTNLAASTGSAKNISMNISTYDQVAAAKNAAAPGDNSNALLIAQLQNTSIAFTTGSATFNSYYDGLASGIGLDVQSAKNTVAQDTAFTQQLSALRESNSGVSLDEELTNLMKYQRSYQASAKLLNAATDMMDVVLGLIR